MHLIEDYGVKLFCVSPGRVAALISHVQPMLHAAFVKTRLGSYAVLERNLLSGHALLWLAWDGSQIVAAAATELHPCAGGLVCSIVACGGRNAAHWTPLLRQIESYAKDEGCRAVRFFGRRGWLRHLPRYQPIGIVAEVTL